METSSENNASFGSPPPYVENQTSTSTSYPIQQTYQNANLPPPPPPQQVTYITQTTNNGFYNDMKSAIPVMPMWCAILLCVVNCLLPGFGTIIASFTVFCCSRSNQAGSSKFGVFCLNFWLGWLQLICVIFIFGWVWSILWGYAFIALAGHNEETTSTTVTTVTNVPAGAYPVPPQVGQAYAGPTAVQPGQYAPGINTSSGVPAPPQPSSGIGAPYAYPATGYPVEKS